MLNLTSSTKFCEAVMKKNLINCIDKNTDDIIKLGTDIYREPELGFKEHKTADKIVSFIENMNISSDNPPMETGLSVTGVKSQIGKKGVNICLLAEMDAIPTRGHPFATDDKYAAHACGHSTQVAIMLGAYKAIHEMGLVDKLGGRVTFISTPAEEYTDFAFREQLRDKGDINYLSGKQDMISKGTFDDVDIIISCHSMGGVAEKMADFNTTLTGFLAKKVIYHGKTAHAGANPHLGVNALNAAMIGLNAIHVQRETFVDEHNVRVHGVIKDGGQTVNSVPDYVELEFMVRGMNVEAILDANAKVNRALEAGAYAVGARCEIIDSPGYLPFHQNVLLSDVMKQNMKEFLPDDRIKDGEKCMASGDVGDLGTIKPCMQLGYGGFNGSIHGPDFCIADDDMAYIIPAKAVAMTVYDLLKNDGEIAKNIIKNSPPIYTKQKYIETWLNKKL